MQATAIFRCDGGGAIGLGHVARCLALAEALEEAGWHCCFLGAYGEVALALIASSGLTAFKMSASAGSDEDADETAERSAALSANVIILDSYEFNEPYARRLAARQPSRLAVIDDFAKWPGYPVDLVVNFTLEAGSLGYPPAPAKLLLGPRYFLARRTLRRARRIIRERRGEARLAVALSGDAAGTLTLAVLRALPPSIGSLRVVIPRSVRNRELIEQEAERFGRNAVIVVQPADMGDVLLHADVAICTGGTIKYEAAYLGAVPFVLSNTVFEAQDLLTWRGLAFDLGLANEANQDKLAAQVNAALSSADLDAMRERCLALFPDDPTTCAAREIARLSEESFTQTNRELGLHYADLFSRHGDSHLTANWSDRQTQEKRFAILTEIGVSSGAKVLDFGCGLGDYLTYLRRSMGFRGEYVGFDLSEPIIQAAKARHRDDPRARFEVRDIFVDPPQESFDYAVICGTFNLKFGGNEAYVFRTLRTLFPIVQKGLALNLMSTYVDFFDPTLYYADPERIFAFCKEELSPAVTLRHDYLLKPDTVPYEYAVYVHRVSAMPRKRRTS